MHGPSSCCPSSSSSPSSSIRPRKWWRAASLKSSSPSWRPSCPSLPRSASSELLPSCSLTTSRADARARIAPSCSASPSTSWVSRWSCRRSLRGCTFCSSLCLCSSSWQSSSSSASRCVAASCGTSGSIASRACGSTRPRGQGARLCRPRQLASCRLRRRRRKSQQAREMHCFGQSSLNTTPPPPPRGSGARGRGWRRCGLSCSP
mmetsp:Transcript_32226/g.62933  ORF Transcript_32226/g.62933 Transcript_32226/m.62933 type:complete len:205 (+) Transcript_32226:137-751(+)